MNNSKVDLSRNIFIVRKGLKLNHIDLVEMTSLTRPILSGIENLSANPTLDSLFKLQDALKLSIDMMFLSKLKFDRLQKLLESKFEKDQQEYDLLIPEKYWKILMRNSGKIEKKNINIVAKICGEIIRLNFSHLENEVLPNMILGASSGVIFQEDGFKHGLEFGAWLGNKLR